MAKGAIWATLPLVLVLLVLVLRVAPAAAQGPLTTQDPASAQPTIPKPMPDLTVPGSGASGGGSKVARAHHPASHAGKNHRYARGGGALPMRDRPALANVELVEPLPHPPQPPHVNVPVPAYPLENFITYFTAPPPPVVCQPTRYDRFKPDPRLVDERPVLCTADNP